jgi:hypothetical protein
MEIETRFINSQHECAYKKVNLVLAFIITFPIDTIFLAFLGILIGIKLFVQREIHMMISGK